jgi:hypothetical protein
MKKNLRGKSIKVDFAGKSHRENAYEHYASFDGAWHWYVLKHYQSSEAEAKNAYARVFCDVVSPIVGKDGELGDVYLREVKQNAVLVHAKKMGDEVDRGRPEPGKVYRLTGAGSVMSGESWANAEVKE